MITDIETRAAPLRHQLRLFVPPLPSASRTVRECVIAFVDPHGSERDELIDFVTAVSEAVVNAIQHAATRELIDVTVGRDKDILIAEVTDHGRGFAPDARTKTATLPSDLLADHGRGLAIMRRYVDSCTIRSAPGSGTSVRLRKSVRP